MSQASQAAAPDERQYLATVAGLVEQAWPAGVPREVRYPLGEIPVTEHLRHAARATPDKAGVVYYGYRLTYAQLDEASDRFAAFLEARGLVRGDRVAVLLYNCPQYFIVFYGILKLGCVHVPVNPMFKQHELRYQLVDADPRVLVTMDRLHPLVEAARDETEPRGGGRHPLHRLPPERAQPAAPEAAAGAGAAARLSRRPRTAGAAGQPRPRLYASRREPRRPGQHQLHRRHHRDAEGVHAHAAQHAACLHRGQGGVSAPRRLARRRPYRVLRAELLDLRPTPAGRHRPDRIDAHLLRPLGRRSRSAGDRAVPGYPPQWTARHHRGADGTPGRRAARSELARSHLLHVVCQEAQPRLPAPLARVDRDYLARVVVRHDRDPHVGHVHHGNAGRRPGPEVHAHLRGAADSRHPVQDRRPRPWPAGAARGRRGDRGVLTIAHEGLLEGPREECGADPGRVVSHRRHRHDRPSGATSTTSVATRRCSRSRG